MATQAEQTALTKRREKGKLNMSREMAKQLLINLGIAEPTEEQISTMLNETGKDTKAKSDLAERQKARIAELEAENEAQKKQIDDASNANLSDVEKLTKEIEALKADNAKQIALNKEMTLKANLAKNGIVDEEATKLVESLSKGEFDADLLGQIIASRVETAKSEKEKELMDKTPDPNGSKKNGNDNPEDAMVKAIGQKMAGTNKSSEDIISQYT